MPEADPRLACIGTSRRGPTIGAPTIGADDVPLEPAPRKRGETALLLAEIRNAEMAIRGFCELAAEQIVPEGEALHGIASALGILSRARSQAEIVLAPRGRALGTGRR